MIVIALEITHRIDLIGERIAQAFHLWSLISESITKYSTTISFVDYDKQKANKQQPQQK